MQSKHKPNSLASPCQLQPSYFLISRQFAELLVNWSATDYQQQLLAYPALFGFWGQALNWWAIIIWLKNDRLPYGQLGLTWLTMTICGAEICSCKLPCVFDAFYERSSNGFRNLCVAWEFSNLNMHSRLLLVDNITITQQAMQVYPKSMQQSQVHAAFFIIKYVPDMINPFLPAQLSHCARAHTLRIRNAKRPIVYLNKSDYESMRRRLPLSTDGSILANRSAIWLRYVNQLASKSPTSRFFHFPTTSHSHIVFLCALVFFYEIRRIILIDWAKARGGAGGAARRLNYNWFRFLCARIWRLVIETC